MRFWIITLCLGFNYGVSIDHLIVAETESKRQHRYQLTIQNADDFLKEHRRRRLTWTPIGAVQGWDAESYARAALDYVNMGYKYIALGGLVRSQTQLILRIVAAVKDVLPDDIRLHLFGLARFGAIREFVRLGVTSIDSASVLRCAWVWLNVEFSERRRMVLRDPHSPSGRLLPCPATCRGRRAHRSTTPEAGEGVPGGDAR